MKYIIYIIIIFTLFFGVNVLAKFGFIYLGITPASYIICGVSLFYFIVSPSKNNIIQRNKDELVVIGLGLAILLYKFLAGHENFYAGFFNGILAPAMLLLLLPKLYTERTIKIKESVWKIVIIFYIIECLLAIIEKVFLTNIFPASVHLENTVTYTNISFRSTALQNHALQNALCVSVIMLFLLFSNLKNKYKYGLLLLGFLAIFTFNSRSSMIVWFAVFAYEGGKAFIKKSNDYIAFGALFITIVSIAFFTIPLIMEQFNLGGRLLYNDIMDNSANVRIESIDILKGSSLSFFILGHTQSVIDQIMYNFDVIVIENFWIIFLLKYGILFLIPLFYAYWKLIKKWMIHYSSSSRNFIFIIFILIASTNNSLEASGVPLIIFFLCSYSFIPSDKIRNQLQNEY